MLVREILTYNPPEGLNLPQLFLLSRCQNLKFQKWTKMSQGWIRWRKFPPSLKFQFQIKRNLKRQKLKLKIKTTVKIWTRYLPLCFQTLIEEPATMFQLPTTFISIISEEKELFTTICRRWRAQRTWRSSTPPTRPGGSGRGKILTIMWLELTSPAK